jgi:hypothetical protein
VFPMAGQIPSGSSKDVGMGLLCLRRRLLTKLHHRFPAGHPPPISGRDKHYSKWDRLHLFFTAA